MIYEANAYDAHAQNASQSKPSIPESLFEFWSMATEENSPEQLDRLSASFLQKIDNTWLINYLKRKIDTLVQISAFDAVYIL